MAIRYDSNIMPDGRRACHKRIPKATTRHNPEILKLRKIARAIGIPWSEVVANKKVAANIEVEAREYEDNARIAGWNTHCRLLGYARSQLPFWRSGYQKTYRRMLAAGGDYTNIPQYDAIAAGVREQVPEFSGVSTSEIFELLLSDYIPRQPVTDHYRNALADLAGDYLRVGLPF